MVVITLLQICVKNAIIMHKNDNELVFSLEPLSKPECEAVLQTNLLHGLGLQHCHYHCDSGLVMSIPSSHCSIQQFPLHSSVVYNV